MPIRKYRLTHRAQMHGEVREPGYVFDLEDGVLGPHKSVITGHERIDVNDDSTRKQPVAVDIPLYVPIDDLTVPPGVTRDIISQRFLALVGFAIGEPERQGAGDMPGHVVSVGDPDAPPDLNGSV